MSLASLARKAAASVRALLTVPTSRVNSFYNLHAKPHQLANRLDVDQLHNIISGAQGGDPRDLFALYRDIVLADSHIQAEFGKRKLAVLGDALSVQPRDKTNADDVAAAIAVQDAISDLGEQRWVMACSHLLDSTLWPVSLLEKVYRPSKKPGLAFELAELVVVPEHLLEYTESRMRLRDTDERGLERGTISEVDPHRYITHRGHLLTTHDCWGGPMRSLLFWWLLSAMDRDWWARFLERYGSPFLLGKYDQADDASRSTLERAFSYAVRLGGLVVSRQTDVEIKQAAAAQSGDAYQTFLTICQREKSKLILGQTLSAEAQSTGMGSGVATEQGNVRQDIRAFDALMLGATLGEQLWAQYLRINNIPGRVPRLVWGCESAADLKSLAELLAALKNAGLEVAEEALEALSTRVGFPLIKPAPVAPPPQLGGGGKSGFEALMALAAATNLPAQITGDDIARAGAADLARTFRGTFSPIRRAILNSSSPEDALLQLTSLYGDPAAPGAEILKTLLANAANGSQLRG